MKTRMFSLFGLILLLIGMSIQPAAAAPHAQSVGPGQRYIIVRLDEVTVVDDQATFTDGPEGEIKYLALVATGNRGEEPIVVQQTGFPIENWYEAQDDGRNATYMAGLDRALPIFALPEDQMGDELVITISVVEDDEVSENALAAHDILRYASGGLVTLMAGPDWGALVTAVSSAVDAAIERSGDLDILGRPIVNRLRRAENFGMPAGTHFVQIEQSAQDDGHAVEAWVKYSVMRMATPTAYSDWCVRATLDRIQIVEASGETYGDIYVRARAADRYTGETLNGATLRMPNHGTKEVKEG
jgi:hypothetical protein